MEYLIGAMHNSKWFIYANSLNLKNVTSNTFNLDFRNEVTDV